MKDTAKVDDIPDYHKICDASTSKSDRDKRNIGDYYINSAKCMSCGDVIRSKNKHHFVSCQCREISIDGGSHYLKRVGLPSSFKDLSEKFNDVE